MPFDLISADYLTLPKGKGGYKMVLLMIDTFSNFVWAYRLKSAGTGKTTLDGLRNLVLHYRKPDTIMTDGGSHFNNEEVQGYCEVQDIRHITTPAYAPWTNGLIENVNKILLGCLRRMCARNLDEMEETDKGPGPTPEKWPDHLEEAIRAMNDRILPAGGLTPCELLWGRRETAQERKDEETTARMETDIEHHLILVDLLRSQGYTDTLTEAANRKRRFDGKVCPVTFVTGDLVQVYDSKLDMTFESRAKLLPQWSPPRKVAEKHLNSYVLCTQDGRELPGTFHARRLRHYVLRKEGPTTSTGREGTRQQWIEEDEEEPGKTMRGLFEEEDVTRVHISKIERENME